ncbi:DnaJ-domain-containing protein [Ascoidea rubescens DSM 1968]|uniref:DnaJ-domain-containing protein n=1 Tax=Ascoidea rubescens DSM 1968 TaxID=1344418 RepID=A0A1D2VAJ5_9ASCO|nr:DnaJ-domain-containing protein [Ascoidea rubescens DSM 1968]ODV58575.1 DnaJ-domain-containing protein [Ascoidea rubescens DSM 1968]
MSYTKEQEILVEKILKSGEFYSILSVEKSATDGEIKKAYRKLALKVHPDKNQHPKAPEAFKKVSKAFEILSDPQKRALFDQTGRDPDSRPSASTSGFQRTTTNGPAPDDIFSAFQAFNGRPMNDDIFNIFFGGQRGTTFTFGPGGFTTHRFPPRQRTYQTHQNSTNQPPPDFLTSLKSLLPLFLILLMPIISMFSAHTSNKIPDFYFTPYNNFNVQRSTQVYNIPYYIKESSLQDLTENDLRVLDKKAENKYITMLNKKCIYENTERNRLINEAHGWFFVDTERLKQGRNYPRPNCDRLASMGLI